MKKCPSCSLLHPDESERCECGFNFVLGERDPRYQKDSQSRPRSRVWLLVLGAAVFTLLCTMLGMWLLPSVWGAAAADYLLDLFVLLLFVAAGLWLCGTGSSWMKSRNPVERSAGLAILILGVFLLLAPISRGLKLLVGSSSTPPPQSQPEVNQVSSSHADISVDLTDRQREIFKTALRVDGTLTEEMHNEFWAPFRERARSEAELADLATAVMSKDSLALAQRYQRAVWESARDSYTAGKVVRHRVVDDLEREMTQAASPKARGNLRRSFSKTSELLEAAASHSSLKVEGRGEIAINPTTIAQVLAGMDGSVSRLQRLLNPFWPAH